MGGYYQADDVRSAANGRWADVLGRLGVRSDLLSSRHGPCPGCGGKDRFRWDDKNGEGTWLCSRGGGGTVSGDGISLLEHVTGKPWKECLQSIGEIVLGDAGLRHGGRPAAMEAGVAPPPPKPRETWVPAYDAAKLAAVAAAAGSDPVGEAWFMDRSPIDVRGMTPGVFLEHLFQPGERVMVFSDFKSQGDFLWEIGRGGYRLGTQPGIKAVRSRLPLDGGKEGVWFLANPIDGLWHGNPRNGGKQSRRSAEAVTAWRYLVLENDCAPPELWLKMLAVTGLPISAIYSSGGRSLHALIREPGDDIASFRETCRMYKQRLPLVGADPGAITPVRLTRLPGCSRNGREQKLIYLNPPATGGKIYLFLKKS